MRKANMRLFKKKYISNCNMYVYILYVVSIT